MFSKFISLNNVRLPAQEQNERKFSFSIKLPPVFAYDEFILDGPTISSHSKKFTKQIYDYMLEFAQYKKNSWEGLGKLKEKLDRYLTKLQSDLSEGNSSDAEKNYKLDALHEYTTSYDLYYDACKQKLEKYLESTKK